MHSPLRLLLLGHGGLGLVPETAKHRVLREYVLHLGLLPPRQLVEAAWGRGARLNLPLRTLLHHDLVHELLREIGLLEVADPLLLGHQVELPHAGRLPSRGLLLHVLLLLLIARRLGLDCVVEAGRVLRVVGRVQEVEKFIVALALALLGVRGLLLLLVLALLLGVQTQLIQRDGLLVDVCERLVFFWRFGRFLLQRIFLVICKQILHVEQLAQLLILKIVHRRLTVRTFVRVLRERLLQLLHLFGALGEFLNIEELLPVAELGDLGALICQARTLLHDDLRVVKGGDFAHLELLLLL